MRDPSGGDDHIGYLSLRQTEKPKAEPAAPKAKTERDLKVAGKQGTREVLHSPLKQSDRPYKYPGLDAIERAQKDKNYPVTQVNPDDLHTTQAHVDRDRLDRIKGDITEPIVVVKHNGKLYIEEGNHRAVKAWQRGEKVPAKIIDVAEKKKA